MVMYNCGMVVECGMVLQGVVVVSLDPFYPSPKFPPVAVQPIGSSFGYNLEARLSWLNLQKSGDESCRDYRLKDGGLAKR